MKKERKNEEWMAEREEGRKRKRLASFIFLLLCIFGKYMDLCDASRKGYVPTSIGLCGGHILKISLRRK
jgi:hypothetical protein